VSLDLVILAAGEGTRMKSTLPKMLHPLGHKPMVMHCVDTALELSEQPPVLVIGHAAQQVRDAVGEKARYVVQEEQLGTGHAVMQASDTLKGKSDHVIVFYGDMPLLRSETLQELRRVQQNNDGPISMLTLISDEPRGFGRIVRNNAGHVIAIVEEAVATPEQLAINELNVGVYCFDADWLWLHLDDIPLTQPKGEYYLTDMVEIAVIQGRAVQAITVTDPGEVLGINTRVHLAEAETALRQRINHQLMLSGVTIVDPATAYIQSTVKIGPDTVIQPNTVIEGQTVIGSGCEIGPNTLIRDSHIGDRCQILASVIEYATMEDDVDVGPYGHLRKGAYLESGVHMGNFGEVKNSRLRKGVKMGHFSYIGDGDIGEETNIGAGTITCNYDGKNKHKTVTGKNVFIGSDTMLVAPLTLGDNSRTGAGSVVTHDVPSGELVYGVPARSPNHEEQASDELNKQEE
jgi:bifunctional UDP-N-acetylglucosamine pyrophosphorylase/glucosamine-1-phosphate N-acetyltransferase